MGVLFGYSALVAHTICLHHYTATESFIHGLFK